MQLSEYRVIKTLPHAKHMATVQLKGDWSRSDNEQFSYPRKVAIGSEDGAAQKPLWPQLPPAP